MGFEPKPAGSWAHTLVAMLRYRSLHSAYFPLSRVYEVATSLVDNSESLYMEYIKWSRHAC